MERHNTGIPEMKIANLFEDVKVLKEVQSLALAILEEDSSLSLEKNKKLQSLINEKFTRRIEI